MLLLVGLGNPGPDYAGSRHNLGFQVVEALARRLNAGKPVQKHRALIAKTEYQGRAILLVQPLTYMNLSGRAVNEIVGNFKITPDQVLVIFDDLDLPPGAIRLRSRGSSGGHRGLQSIIDALGTVEIPRLRIGIGKAPEGMEVADYVLLPPLGTEKVILGEAVERSVEAVLCFIEHGLETAMNQFNTQDD